MNPTNALAAVALRRSARAAFLAVLMAALTTQAAYPGAESRGGSNYLWFQIDNCFASGRDPYGVISNYSDSQSKAVIDQQLEDMFAAGQKRLRVGLFHQRGLDSGTVMDSTGGNLSAENRQKLTDFLAAVKAKGFHAILFAFLPINANNAKTWTQWDEGMFQENWNLIVNIRPIVANAGIQYRIDLMGEGVPNPNQQILKDYCRKLWLNYVFVFGKGDTVGFSFNGNPNEIGGRASTLPFIYKYDYPYLYDFHFYHPAYNSFVAAHEALANLVDPATGLPQPQNQGWIIGEALYNDGQQAMELSDAIQDTSRVTFFVLQWPVTRLKRSQGCTANIAPPVDFDQYIAEGF